MVNFYELLDKLNKVNLAENRKRIFGEPGHILVHYKDTLRAVWWYNILDQKLEFSETATTHQDTKAFKDPFVNARGWIRGRVFQDKDNYYIAVSIEDWLEYKVTNKSIADLYSQIQDKFKHSISDVVDEEGYSLSENKKKG